jgi:CRISPR/Cas system CMR subunit Cmr4 (Cas7 group RAMP superfamily)
MMTAGAFIVRFAVDYVMKGGLDGDARTPAFAMHHATSIVGFTDALLLFVAARSLAGAWHMWIRTRPMIEQHKAAQVEATGQK